MAALTTSLWVSECYFFAQRDLRSLKETFEKFKKTIYEKIFRNYLHENQILFFFIVSFKNVYVLYKYKMH